MAKNNLRSFTLIELLIVIAIIAVIAAVIIASTGSSRISARDSRRIQDLKELQTALEFYYDDNKKYPDISTGCCIESSSEFKDALVPDYISTLPQDPTYPDQCYFYRSSPDASYYKIFANRILKVCIIFLLVIYISISIYLFVFYFIFYLFFFFSFVFLFFFFYF